MVDLNFLFSLRIGSRNASLHGLIGSDIRLGQHVHTHSAWGLRYCYGDVAARFNDSNIRGRLQLNSLTFRATNVAGSSSIVTLLSAV